MLQFLLETESVKHQSASPNFLSSSSFFILYSYIPFLSQVWLPVKVKQSIGISRVTFNCIYYCIHVLVTESDSQIMSSWYHYVVSTGSNVQASSSPVLSVSWCLRMLWRQLTLLHHLFLLKPLVVPPVGWKGHQYGIVDRMLVIDKRGIRMLQLNIWWQNFSKWWAGRKLKFACVRG